MAIIKKSGKSARMHFNNINEKNVEKNIIANVLGRLVVYQAKGSNFSSRFLINPAGERSIEYSFFFLTHKIYFYVSSVLSSLLLFSICFALPQSDVRSEAS